MPKPADIEEARRRLAERPLKGDPTAEPGETLDEKAERLGAVEPAVTTTTEYAVRFEPGEIVGRPSREFAVNTIRAVQSRGGTAALMVRQITTTDWTEAKET